MSFSKGLSLDPVVPDDEGRSSNNDTLKWAIAAGAAVFASALTAYAGYRFFSSPVPEEAKAAPKPKVIRKKRIVKKNSAKTLSPPAEPVVIEAAGEPDVFDRLVTQSLSLSSTPPVYPTYTSEDLASKVAEADAALDGLEMNESILSAIKDEKFTELLSLLTTVNPDDYDISLRLDAAKWILKYSTTDLVVALQNPECQISQQDLVNKSQEFLQLVWNFIDFDGSSFTPEKFEQFLLTKLDVSQRRNDLLSLFDVYEKAKSMESSELQMAAFHVSPILGQWDDFLKYGKEIQKHQPEFLKQLHSICMQQVQFPDYETLFDTIKNSRQNLPSLPLDKLQSLPRTYMINKAKLKFVDAHGENEAVADQIKQSLAEQQHWQDVDLEQTSPAIVRNGALVQCTGFSPMPTSLIGVFKDGEFVLRGYSEQEAPNVGMMKYSEKLTIQRSAQDKSLWTGRSEVTQEFQSFGAQSSEEMNVTMEFDIQLTVTEQNV